MTDIIVNYDTREKTPWIFDEEKGKSGYKSRIVGCELATISAADYQIKEYPDLIRIERKIGLRELYGNYSPVEHNERFIREMEKLKDVKYKYLVIESILSLDLLSMSVQQFRNSLPASRVISWIYDLQREYGIIPIFAGDAGKKISRILIEDVIRKEL